MTAWLEQLLTLLQFILLMHLQNVTVRNFRRLKNVQIDLDKATSIFVGSNKSGKTSATYILEKFLGHQSKGLSVHDFSSDCWKEFNEKVELADGVEPMFPSIGIDLWFEVNDADLQDLTSSLLPLAIPLRPSQFLGSTFCFKAM